MLVERTRRGARAVEPGDLFVIIRSFMAAVAVIAIPIAVVGAQPQQPRKSEHSTKKVCDVAQPTGSRLGGIRRCRTAAEREEHKAEARQVVDRIQMMKPTLCPPNC